MNAREFYEKVRELRRWQKAYFTTRTKQALEESKSLERIIDAEIDRVQKIMEERNNPKIFNDKT